MEKVRCPLDEKVVVTKEYVDTHCIAHCGHEQFIKCLERARKNQEKRMDEAVFELSYLWFNNLGIALIKERKMQGMIICLNCESERPLEDSYCGKCGQFLPAVCLDCDLGNPWYFAWRRGCGANLLSQELADQKIEDLDAELMEWLQSYLTPKIGIAA